MVLASSAGGVSLDWYYGQPVEFKLVSWDMSTVYVPASSPTLGAGGVNGLSQTLYAGAGSGGVYYDTFGKSSLDSAYQESYREDGWGIFKIASVVNPVTGETLWWDGKDGQEITGMYYGLVDNAVVPSGTKANQYTVQSQNIRYDIYVNPAGTLESAQTEGLFGPGQGSFGRTAFDQYNGITDGRLLLEGNSADGLDPVPGTPAEDAQFLSYFTPNSSFTSGEGDYQSRIRLTGGEWYDQFYAGYGSDDVDLAGYFDSGSTGNWTTQSQSPPRPVNSPAAVPEPLTLVGVGLGLASLGNYIRRRRATL